MRKSRKSTGATLWVPVIFGLVFIVAIIAFAVQTWELVDTIFPAENMFMKVATVINLDVMSILYASAEMFYPFSARSTKHLAFGMWVSTFIGALLASIIYMYLSSLHLLHGTLDIRYLYLAYGIVVLAMSANIIAITVGIRMEWNAAFPDEEDEFLLQEELPEIPPQPLIDRKAGWTQEDYDAKLEQMAREKSHLEVELRKAQQVQHNGHTHTDEAFPKGQSS